MEKDNFLDTFHPVDKYVGCSALLRNHKHHDFPGLNIAVEELVKREISPKIASEIYVAPPLNISRPIPCLSPKYVEEQDNTKEDQVLQLVRKKYFWRRKKKQMQVIANRLTTRHVLFPELVKTMEEEEPISRLPYAVVKMTDHLANNPDKYFKGLYNWYYGNAMEKVTIRNDRFLLYTGGKNLNDLSMALFEKPRKSNKVPVLSPQVSMSMAGSGFIYDIIANNSVGAIGVRQRNACSFLNYYEVTDGGFSFRNFSTVKSSEYPFVAMDNNHTEFCTINANRTVQFWRPDQSTKCTEQMSLPTNDEKLADRFAQVKYDGERPCQIFAIADRKNVYVYDKRKSLAEPCSHLEPNKQTELCEEISVIIPSVKEKNWYLGMNHSCLLLDTRMGFAEKWTHMLSQPPSFGRAFRINNESGTLNEAVILSTQSTNEAVAVYRIENESRTTCSPARLPSRLDTLNEAHMNGVLTNPHLQHKFRYCVIGLVPYETRKRMGVLSLISTGDIFHQYAKPNAGVFDKNSTALNEEELQYLEDWEDEFQTKNINQKRDLTFTRVADFSTLVNSVDESLEIPLWKSRAVHQEKHWKIQVKNLYTYRDLLSPHLLNDYGVDDLDDSSDECEGDALADESEKVDNWLSGNYGQYYDDALKIEDKTDVFASEDVLNLDSATELDVIVPPEHDVELSKPKVKRRKR